jgi:chloride channel 3/4/5
MIELLSSWLSDLRQGYCATHIWSSQAFCCPKNTEFCPDWIPWTTHFARPHLSPAVIHALTYIGSALFFAFLSTLLVTLAKHEVIDKRGLIHPVFYAASSGIPQVKTILGGFVIRGCLGIQTLVFKLLALIPSIASGLIIGAQGPLVHISVAIGNVVSRLFNKYNVNEGKRREMLSAASAAGVSVAFGAPIGGVLFALEEVSYYFPLKTMWRSFYCAMIAAVTLRLTNPFGTGKMVRFEVTSQSFWTVPDILPFTLLGIFGGLYGAMFISVVSKKMQIDAKSGGGVGWKIFQVLLVAGITATLSVGHRYTEMSNGSLIAELFTDCKEPDHGSLCEMPGLEAWKALSWAWAVKVSMMIAAFGLHVPAGVFVPCMVIGALQGRLLALFVTGLQG